MYDLDEYRKEDLSFNRRSVLKILRLHRKKGWLSAETAGNGPVGHSAQPLHPTMDDCRVLE